MGESRHFRAGQKAPKNGVYIELGEEGSSVVNPRQIHLNTGDRFPENSNHNRIWSLKVNKG